MMSTLRPIRWSPIIAALVVAGAVATVVDAAGRVVSGAADATVKVGMIPDAGATQVSVQEKGPLQTYLAKAMGRPVNLVIPTNYNATVEGLGNGSLDFAYLGGLTYVKAHATYGVVPLVQRDIDQQFHSLLFTQTTSNIHGIVDLKGKRFAFGDINSTSGHLMPYRAMTQAGIDPDKSLSFRYTGSHAATVQAVASGAVDAGAADETVFKSLVTDGKVDGSKLRVFYTTPAFVDYVWVARKDIAAAAQQQFADAFLKLAAGRDDAVLTILRGQHFVRANDAEYRDIADVARKLGMF
jgi:phosphonate transport system substrate-binding protein